MSSLYVAVSLSEIERSRILGHIPDKRNVKPCPSPTSITVSLAELFSNVNPSDKNMLQYIPDGFLNDAQKEAKAEAFKATAEYIEKKNKQRLAKSDKATRGDSFVGEPYIDYQRDGNTIIFLFRKKTA